MLQYLIDKYIEYYCKRHGHNWVYADVDYTIEPFCFKCGTLKYKRKCT